MGRKASKIKKRMNKTYSNQKRAAKRLGLAPLDMVKAAHEKNIQLHDPDELPANGEFGCTKCDLYFIDGVTLKAHFKTKAHKKRLKIWNEPCHNQKDAEWAAGLF